VGSPEYLKQENRLGTRARHKTGVQCHTGKKGG
jgi:hypothetical protein